MDQAIISQLDGTRKLQEWLNLERTAFLTDGGGADTGGPNKFAHGPSTWQRSQQPSSSLAFVPASLRFNPARRPVGQPWDNVYRFAPLTIPPASTESTWFT
jgi:hypothetical protein